MRKNLMPVGLALIVGTLFIGAGPAMAYLVGAYSAPSDKMDACDKRVQLAIARVKQSTSGALHFSCEAGLVQQLWFPEKNAIGKQWMQFVLKKRDLFVPKDMVLKPSESEGGVTMYWRGLKLLNNRIQLVSASANGQFSKHAAMGLSVGILSGLPDMQTLKSKVPAVTQVAASKAAQQQWEEEHPISPLVIKKSELGVYTSQDGKPHLSWVLDCQGTLKKDEAPISFSCTVNADSGIPESCACSPRGCSL